MPRRPRPPTRKHSGGITRRWRTTRKRSRRPRRKAHRRRSARGFARLQKIDDAPTYLGRSHSDFPAVGAKVYPAANPDHWNIDAILYQAADRTETWYFQNLYIDPNQPFDSGWLRDINIPGQDYRLAHILE